METVPPIVLRGLGLVGYYLTMLTGMALIPLGVPGLFLIALATLIVRLAAGPDVMPWWVVILLLVLAMLGELLEAMAGFAGARQAKGSIRSALGAMAGGFAGAILGAPFGLLIGSLAGALLGTFAGALLVEYARTREGAFSWRVASHALKGRLAGSLIKIGIAGVMIFVVTAVLIL